MNYEYIIALAVFCVLFRVGLVLMKRIRRVKLANLVFMALVYIPYICLCVYVYKTDTDPTRWNFFNTLPTANVSPFMFSLMPILLILPKKARKYVYLLISMLTVGMFLSGALGCVGNALRNYRFHWHFMLDYLAHFALSAFGIFLVKSKQVKISFKNCLFSGSIIYAVATVMMILNVIFDKSFFGLSLNGNHNIYNMVLVEDSYLSALIYFIGLGLVLFIGAVLCKAISKRSLPCPKRSK